MCGLGYPTYPKNFNPYPKRFFSKFWSLEKIWSEKYDKAVHMKMEIKGSAV